LQQKGLKIYTGRTQRNAGLPVWQRPVDFYYQKTEYLKAGQTALVVADG